MIVSYGNKILPYLENLKRQLQELKSLEEIKDTLNNRLEKTVHHNLKFVFDKLPTYEIKSVVLKENQYYEYLEFFKRNNPNCENTDWLEEYFIGMTKERTCCGFFLDKTLVSCTDSPCMPYMSDAVQEIGINTIEDYRGRGYATDACVLCAQEIVKSGKCPQWSTSAENVASQKLARKVGFIKFADVLTVTL
jgi:RimJ/RimL family protein N-acetyltransferase